MTDLASFARVAVPGWLIYLILVEEKDRSGLYNCLVTNG